MKRLLGLLPSGLALLADGAWIAVVYALLQAGRHAPIVLGPVAFAAVAAVGAVAGSVGPARIGRAWPPVAVALVVLAVAAGWATSPTIAATLASGNPGSAVIADPAGWLAGLACFRGIALARPGRSAPVGVVVTTGVLAIVAAFLLGGAVDAQARVVFRDAGVPSTIVFLAAGLVAFSLARIRELDDEAGFDWRRNPVWLALLVAIVAALLVVAVPSSLALGPVIVLVIAALPVPLLIVGLFSGVDRRGWKLVFLMCGIAVLVYAAVRLFSPTGGAPLGGGGGALGPPTPPEQTWMTVAAWTGFIVATAIVIALLAALWMRQARSKPDDDVAEERTIDYGNGPDRPRRRRRSWLRRRPHPTDAPTAYLAALEALGRSSEGLRRMPGETPSEHARRVRPQLAGVPGPAALGLLAADYELARFGGRTLTPREHERGLSRWRRLRAALDGTRP